VPPKVVCQFNFGLSNVRLIFKQDVKVELD